MGYETLALVYNKSQMPVVPTTWDEYENMLATTPTAGTI
jgi:maltose-binding protein MalE